MKIGIISNSESFFGLAHALAGRGFQVYVFCALTNDPEHIQQLAAFKSALPMIHFSDEVDAKKDLYKWLKQTNPALCFVLGYRSLIKLEYILGTSAKLYNIHYGPLPAYRGAMPVFWQLKNGVGQLEMVIHVLTEQFDAGPVVWHKAIANKPFIDYRSAHTLFNQACVEGVFYLIQYALQGIDAPLVDRTHVSASYHPRASAKDVAINWAAQSVDEIVNLVRACNPWNKGASTFFNKQPLKLMDAVKGDDAPGEPSRAGTILSTGEQLVIAGTNRQTLRVNMIYMGNCYVPSYRCTDWGIRPGDCLE